MAEEAPMKIRIPKESEILGEVIGMMGGSRRRSHSCGAAPMSAGKAAACPDVIAVR